MLSHRDHEYIKTSVALVLGSSLKCSLTYVLKLDFEVHVFIFAGKLFQSFIAEYTKLFLLHCEILGIVKFLFVALLVLPWLKVKFWLRYVGARSFAILKTWFNLSWDTLSGTFNILTLSKISYVMEVLGSMFNIKRTTLFWHIWSFFNIVLLILLNHADEA